MAQSLALINRSNGPHAIEADITPDALQIRLTKQLCDALRLPGPLEAGEINARAQAAIDALNGIGPRDEMEGMLAVQMVTVSNTALEYLQQASDPSESLESRELNFRHAQKLMALYLRQVEAFDRHRRSKAMERQIRQSQETAGIPLPVRLHMYAAERAKAEEQTKAATDQKRQENNDACRTEVEPRQTIAPQQPRASDPPVCGLLPSMAPPSTPTNSRKDSVPVGRRPRGLDADEELGHARDWITG